MTDIERLERFIRRREKWKDWVPTQVGTDLQALRKQEHAMWEGIILLGFCLFSTIDGRNLFDPLNLIAAVCGPGFIVYLWMEADRISKLREVFERTAIQNASDLLDELRRRDADPAPQGPPAS